jgi:hypothetical protein
VQIEWPHGAIVQDSRILVFDSFETEIQRKCHNIYPFKEMQNRLGQRKLAPCI